MDPSHISPPLPPGTSLAMESEMPREFLRERLAFFSRVLFILAFVFYVLGNLIVWLGPEESLRGWLLPDDLLHLLACAIFAAMWMLTTWRDPPLTRLKVIDAAGTILACLTYAFIGLSWGAATSEYAALLATTNTLIARAVIVPSRPLRTLWIGVFSAAAATAAAWMILLRPDAVRAPSDPVILASILTIWAAVAVVVSTVASGVIYGLRREVKQAKRLGQYTLEERLGSGGMGVVYKAKHLLLRRPTAIKLLRPDVAGEKSIARFEREVQLTSLLTHPNTVSIYDYGRTPGGIFYYAMEYLCGLTIDQLLAKEGPQPAGRTVYILKQVCGSLAEAHAEGLIHRDIKAANVILCERGGAHDFVKVVDFGLVKDTSNIANIAVTVSDTIAGTPHYMSPESIRTPDKIDGRSDLYAVGVLGYYLLTAKHVFENKNFVEVCGQHLHTQPPLPSTRTERPIPRDLEAVIMTCLAKDPDRRPRDAEALGQALCGCACASEWGEEQARAWWADYEKRRQDTKSAPEAGTYQPSEATSLPTAVLVPARSEGPS
jgi:serine/threonine-protein kinase